MGGSKGLGGRDPIQESAPVASPNELHHADILTDVYAIASLVLGLHVQVQVCQQSTVRDPICLRGSFVAPVLVFLEPPLKVH